MRALQAAIGKCAMPAGLVSMLHGTSNAVGLALVRHPLIKAVGFTGSLQGGRALCDAAASRPEPIPVYAEMGSTNPVFLLPGALAAKGAEIAQGLAQSVTLGVGQFCTNPGLVFAVEGPEFQQFAVCAAELIRQVPPGTMLTAGMCARYRQGVAEFARIPGVRVAASASGAQQGQAAATVFATDVETFLKTPALHEELFGPCTLIVSCNSHAALLQAASRLRGQLTASVHGTAEDLLVNSTLVDILSQKAGRLIFNGFPTGVEVCAAMQHGGPYPATSNAHFTSVGTAAVLRFARPVCYQDFPQELLPPELRDRNERGIWRQVDGRFTAEALGFGLWALGRAPPAVPKA
jgi:NADP-dependent aldehyde dehydrogenase